MRNNKLCMAFLVLFCNIGFAVHQRSATTDIVLASEMVFATNSYFPKSHCVRVPKGVCIKAVCSDVCEKAVEVKNQGDYVNTEKLPPDKLNQTGPKKPQVKPEIRQDFFYTPEQAREELKRFAQSYSTLEEWKARKQNIREGILRGAELWPIPEKTPLEVIAHSKRNHDGYTVENVAIKTTDTTWLTGNVYRPIQGSGPFAGVLCPHGHWDDGRFREDMQKRCATFARMGAVVFAYDMIGFGELKDPKYPHGKIDGVWRHGCPKILKKQLWNNIRALDYIISLDKVDPQRTAVTGASGGGTQSFLLTAVDDRIRVSIPVVMTSAWMFGGCNCESGMPIHKSEMHETNNAEITALAAPRPLLLVSCGKDWTRMTPTLELPYIKKLYGLYGKTCNVENWHLVDEGHDYNLSKRVAVYWFLARHFGLDIQQVMDKNGNFETREDTITIEPKEALLVFDANHPRRKSTKLY